MGGLLMNLAVLRVVKPTGEQREITPWNGEHVRFNHVLIMCSKPPSKVPSTIDGLC